MPEIARFFGTIIRMYAEAGEPHHRPHFHAYYQDATAVYSIYDVQVLAGQIPRRQHRLAVAWAELQATSVGIGGELGIAPVRAIRQAN